GSKQVGVAKPVALAGFSVSGADAGNYTFSQPANIAANITPAPLTVSGMSGGSKIYDGTTVAPLNTNGATLSGVLPGDAVALGGTAAGAFADKSAGTGKAVTVTGLSATGADAGNYT